MNQVFAVVMTAVALFTVGVGALFGIWMGAEETERTLAGPIDVTVYIDYGDGDAEVYEISTVNATAYGVLLDAARPEVGNFTVRATYYSNYDAVLVEEIGGRTNGDGGRYWVYRVNGEFANVGADRCVLHEGDLVEWSFESWG
ncbi:MAG TPA: DUF4430 domain-containing protein [Thermoplasmata archaeon]|nr:DUF4430 domain-containing protein [Thermoplasmata archaeon]